MSNGHRALTALGAAIAAAVLAPASAPAAPGDPACAPDKTLAPIAQVEEDGRSAPLVATHDARVRVSWNGDVRHPRVSVPGDVRVLGRKPTELRLIAPVAPSLAVTATWEQSRDPSDDTIEPDDPATRCVATQTFAVPIAATRRTRAVYNLRGSGDGWAAFAVSPDRTHGDLSPFELSVRVAKGARFPSPRSKARKMRVPLRQVDQVKYRKRLPGQIEATTPVACRIFWLVCGRIVTQVSKLGERSPRGWFGKRSIDNAGSLLLARTQPLRTAAPAGVVLYAHPGRGEPTTLGYDVQVRQSGRLVGRVRRAARCGKEPSGFGERFYRCRFVRSRNG